MATIDYSSVATATITNNGTSSIFVQLYRVNLFATIKAGDALKLAIDSSEEAVYYKGLENGVEKDVYTLLTEEPADWSTNYGDYFVWDTAKKTFVANTDDTYASNTFYAKSSAIVDKTIEVAIA